MARPTVENKRKAYKVFMTVQERNLAQEKMDISGKKDFSEWARQQLTCGEEKHLRANPREVLKELGALRDTSSSIAGKLDRILNYIGKEERTKDPGGLQSELTEVIRQYVAVKNKMVLAIQKLYRS